MDMDKNGGYGILKSMYSLQTSLKLCVKWFQWIRAIYKI